jgi:uncharacterized protein (TIGR03083 family)
MEPKEYVAALRREGAALAAAAEGRLESTVPSCPEWTVADLVWHVGNVHHFWREVTERRLQDPEAVTRPPRPSDGELVGWFASGVEQAAAVLESTDPMTPVWTWAPRRDVGFIQRRMAQETAVHRVDAELAAGSPRPVEADLAVDGIDEFLTLFMTPARLQGEGAESVHLHATDAPGEWVVKVRDGTVSVEQEHGKADVAVRAPASDLLLLLWRRVSPEAVEVLGDGEALGRFLARTSL